MTATSSRQQILKECRPSPDQARCPSKPLAVSQLHQPCLPQGSGHDWLLSPRDQRDSHRGGVVVVGGGWWWLVVIVGGLVAVVVLTVCNGNVSIDITALCT